jgi:hypothetical protein
LREHDKTKQINDVDPYAEVYQFRNNIFGILTHSLDGMGDPWIYLIVGPQKAMLIDTSFGLGDLKGLVRELIDDMPYYVVNTHCADRISSPEIMCHFKSASGNLNRKLDI